MEFYLIMKVLEEEKHLFQKITRAVSEIFRGSRKFFYFRNLNAKRDWGSAKDYVESMWLMLKAKNLLTML